jgi:Uma2 family endonuclease
VIFIGSVAFTAARMGAGSAAAPAAASEPAPNCCKNLLRVVILLVILPVVMVTTLMKSIIERMATRTLLTIDDFERLPAEQAENHELVDGELIYVSGNVPDHNLLRDSTAQLMRTVVRQQRLGIVITEQEYDFLGNAHGPDISFFSLEKLSLLDRRKRVQRFVPDLAIEIACPSDTYMGLLGKKDRYLAAGTKEVWLISLDTREVSVYPEGRVFRGSDELSTTLIPGFSITLEQLFTEAEV